MTLIVSFEYQHTPVLIGDLLVTSPGTSSKESPTPLVQTPNRIIGNEAERSVSNVQQKIAILHEQVCLAWSGSLIHAKSYAEYLRRFLSGRASVSYEELRKVIRAYPREDLEGHLQFVIYSWHGNGWGYFSNLVPFDLGPLAQIRVGGSGTAHFVKNIEHVARSRVVGNLDPYTELSLRALTYASLASSEQFFGGIGLTDWWGGGFEVAVRREDRFTKLGPICWFFWECTEVAPLHFRMETLPSFMYQFYIDETAAFWIDERENGTNQLHIISPPFQTKVPQIDRPKAFETDIVVNIARIQMLNGITGYGCNVDSSKGIGDDRVLEIAWLEADTKTTIKFNE